MCRPFDLSEGLSALAGAALVLALGIVSPEQAGPLLAGTLPILGFFLGMMAITAAAEQAGFFEWLASGATRLSRGDPRRLFALLFLASAVVTVFLSNDATVLAMTPLVVTVSKQTRQPAAPYAFACVLVANLASTLLPMSNPLNVIMLTSFPRPLHEFVRYLALPTVVALLSAYAILRWRFRQDLQAGSSCVPDQPSTDRPYLRFVAGALAAIAVAYLVAAAEGLPLAIVALAGAAMLLAGSAAFGRFRPRELAGRISWSVFPFVAGMFVVVQALENGGWTNELANLILAMPRLNPLLGTLGATFLVGLGANVVNNLPAAVVMASALHQTAGPPPELLYGSILGADLGPCLSVTGSLATMLWLMILRRQGIAMTAWRYLTVGLLVTPPVLALSAVALWAMLKLS